VLIRLLMLEKHHNAKRLWNTTAKMKVSLSTCSDVFEGFSVSLHVVMYLKVSLSLSTCSDVFEGFSVSTCSDVFEGFSLYM